MRALLPGRKVLVVGIYLADKPNTAAQIVTDTLFPYTTLFRSRKSVV